MAEKRDMTPEAANKALEDFLNAQQDAPTVHQVEQRLELHLTGTDAYIPSYTRQVMDKNHGAPVEAVLTKTDAGAKKVYIYPAEQPVDKSARQLRGDDTMGPARFAFGVPLRILGLKLPPTRKIILPLKTLDVPKQGTVYWASFAEIEKESRDIDAEALAAAKQAKAAKAKARKSRKSAAASDASSPAPAPQTGTANGTEK